MIVVDTNVIGYLYLSSEKSELVEKTLLQDAGWAAPILWRSELRNVLAMYIRNQRISLGDATQIMNAALSLMRDGEYEVNSGQVLSLATGSQCSAFDCEFVALAQALGPQKAPQGGPWPWLLPGPRCLRRSLVRNRSRNCHDPSP